MSVVNPQTLRRLGCELWWPGMAVSANAPKVITASGDVKQVLPFPGASIGIFDGSGDYLSIPDSNDWTFTGDFTIECNIYVTTLGVVREFVSQSGAGDSNTWWGFRIDTAGRLWFQYKYNGSVIENIYSTNQVVFINTFYHVSVVRSGSTWTLYVNGISPTTTHDVNMGANAFQNLSQSLQIGIWGTSTYPMIGYLSELRISNVARYTTNFTPHKYQLENDANTKLLLHFNNTGTTVTDSSSAPKTVTTYGNAKCIASPVQGGGMAYFDGSGDYLNVTQPDTTTFVLGTYDFCIESWCYFKAVNSPIIANRANGSPRGWVLHFSSAGKIVLAAYVGGWIEPFIDSTGITVSLNTWYHVALTHTGSTWKLFINGVLANTVTNANGLDAKYVNETPCPISIGTAAYNVENYATAYFANVRISKDTPRYTANFTPQTTPFLSDSNTKLLLHFNGMNQSFYDSSDPPGDNGFAILPDGVSVTPAGTFTSVKGKDGLDYLKFDGSTNYISLGDHDAWTIYINDFTICGWVKFGTVESRQTIFSQNVDANNRWNFGFAYSTTTLTLYGIASSSVIFQYSCPFSPTANTWYHITVQRSGSNCIIMINGIPQIVTTTTAWIGLVNFNNTFYIGRSYPGSWECYNLIVKDLMIFKGTALTYDQINTIIDETFIY